MEKQTCEKDPQQIWYFFSAAVRPTVSNYRPIRPAVLSHPFCPFLLASRDLFRCGLCIFNFGKQRRSGSKKVAAERKYERVVYVQSDCIRPCSCKAASGVGTTPVLCAETPLRPPVPRALFLLRNLNSQTLCLGLVCHGLVLTLLSAHFSPFPDPFWSIPLEFAARISSRVRLCGTSVCCLRKYINPAFSLFLPVSRTALSFFTGSRNENSTTTSCTSSVLISTTWALSRSQSCRFRLV